MPSKPKTKPVKAWAALSNYDDQLFQQVFSTKEEAKETWPLQRCIQVMITPITRKQTKSRVRGVK